MSTPNTPNRSTPSAPPGRKGPSRTNPHGASPPKETTPETAEPEVKVPDAIVSLLSPEDVELLKIFDDIRTTEADVDLKNYAPYIVVTGDTSSGKSSTMEALSWIHFPKASSICTRFVTEIRLRRDIRPFFRATIDPSQDTSRTQEELDEIAAWEPYRNLDALEEIIAEASILMGISLKPGEKDTRLSSSSERVPSLKSFSDDTLVLEIHSPDVPDITLVDLPGLIRNDTSQEGPELVKQINRKWIAKENAIILAIIASNNAEANQEVISLVKEVDPEGRRSIPVLTKPDQLSDDPIALQECVDKVVGVKKHEFFTQPFHVLRNQSQKELLEGGSKSTQGVLSPKDRSLRDQNELKFFSASEWDEARGTKRCGIENLRKQLQLTLSIEMKRSLFHMRKAVQQKLFTVERELSDGRFVDKSDDEHRKDFKLKFQHLAIVASEGIRGTNEDYFYSYGDHEKNIKEGKPLKPHPKRIRGNLNLLYDGFQEKLMKEGHNAVLAGTSDDPEEAEKFIRNAMDILRMDAGLELPKEFNPQRINQFFHSYSVNWSSMSLRLVDKVVNACENFLACLLHTHFGEIGVESSSIVQHFGLDEFLNIQRKKAEEEAQKLEMDRKSPLITRNQFLERELDEYDMKEAFRKHNLAPPRYTESEKLNKFQHNHLSHARATGQATKEEKTRDRAVTFLGKMRIYYKFQLEIFIDNVITQVIERHLISGLHTILSEVPTWSDEKLDGFWNTEERRTIMADKKRLEGSRDALQRNKKRLKEWEEHRQRVAGIR